MQQTPSFVYFNPINERVQHPQQEYNFSIGPGSHYSYPEGPQVYGGQRGIIASTF